MNESDREALFGALKQGDLETVRTIVDRFVEVHSDKDYMGRCLRTAIAGNHMPLVKYFLDQGVDVNYSIPEIKYFGGLKYACGEGYLELAQYLLSRGAEICTSTSQENPLLTAIHGRHVHVVKWLLTTDIDVHANYLTDGGGYTNALRLASNWGDDDEIVKILIAAGCELPSAPTETSPASELPSGMNSSAPFAALMENNKTDVSDAYQDWALFYKFDGGRPAEFFEVRRFGNKLWKASGRPKTLGKSSSLDLGSESAATQGFQDACVEAESNGFTRVLSGNYGRQGLDVNLLTESIYHGAKLAFGSMITAHPDATLTQFGLFSDDSAMTIVPAASSSEAIAEADEDGEAIWNTSAWPFDDGGEFLDPAYRMILPPHQGIPCDADDDFGRSVFESCAEALKRLRDEGFFGEPSDELVVLFQVSDSNAAIGLNESLNTQSTFKRYSDWMAG